MSYKEIKEKVCLGELNLFSASLLASVDYNLEKVKGSKDLHDMKTEILEWLVKASKEQAKQCCAEARRKLHIISEAYRQAGYKLFSFEGKLVEASLCSRALFGARRLGYTLFEVGLEFDPYLNLPVIPGSSIKGAISSAWEALGFGEQEKELVFGGVGVGACVFGDAYPIEPNPDGFILYPEVMTPHYQDDIMYEDKVAPNPITYICVAPGVKFGFIIAVDKVVPAELVDKLRRTFLFAIQMGLGAKTSVGYGVFTVTSLNIQLSDVMCYGGSCKGALPR